MMKTGLNGFEGAFALLDGFVFLDAESRENALWAALWVNEMPRSLYPHPRPPIVIVEGGTESGKTTLIQRIAAAVGGPYPMLRSGGFPSEKDLNVVAAKGVPMLVIDHPVVNRKRCADLCMFVCDQRRVWRKSGTQELESCSVKCVTFIETCGGALSEDLERRAIWIRLGRR